MPHRRPALDAARRYLAACVQRCRNTDEDRLPPVKRLAADAGVSYVTMLRAVDSMRHLLVVNHGGIRVARAQGGAPAYEPEPITSPPPPSRWEQTYEAIRRDLLRCALPPGEPLPQALQLQRRYGVGPVPIRRALRRLVADGFVQPMGRGYVPRTSLPPSGYGRVVLILAGSRYGLHTPTPRTRDHIRVFDQECVRRGLRLEILPHYLAFWRIANLGHLGFDLKAGSILGASIWMAGIAYVENFFSILAYLHDMRVPTALLDEAGNVPAEEVRKRHRKLLLAELAVSGRSGYHMGRHLLESGHRRVAFLTTRTPGVAIENRLAGLRRAFDEARLPDAVRVCVFDHIEPNGSALANQAAQLAQLVMTSPTNQALDDKKDRDLMKAGLVQAFGGVLRSTHVERRSAGVLSSLLDERDCTAWVGHNDAFALEALAFLNDTRKKRKNRGQRIALAGFDNTVESTYHRVTSYDFNAIALFRQSLEYFLASPRLWQHMAETGTRGIEGHVTPRASTLSRV